MGFLLPKKIHLLLVIKQNFSITRYKHLRMRNTIIPNFHSLIINDFLDVFLGKYFSGSKEIWHVSKLIFVLSHGQSFIERWFSVNKQLMDTDMKEKSLVSQRIVTMRQPAATWVSVPFSLHQNCGKALCWPVKMIRTYRNQKRAMSDQNKVWNTKSSVRS